MKRLAMLGICGALAGCAAMGPPPDPATLGPRPTIDPEPQVKSLMDRFLKDPSSAQYRKVGGPVPGRAQEPLIRGGDVVEGWGYCYLVNAKNSYGGYTGYTPYYFVFRRSRLVGWAANPQLSSWNCF